jgi:hypothetical protein
MAGAATVAVLALMLVPLGPVGTPGSPTPAAAQSGDEQFFLSQINALRSSRGLAPLAVDGNMSALAYAHTAEMAAAGRLYHAGRLSAGVEGPWTKLGENVGFGSYPDLVWNAFVNSPTHYANLVDPQFTHVGVAVVHSGGVLWTTHRFVGRGGGGGGEYVEEPPPPPRRAAPAPRPQPQVSAPEPPPEPEPAPPPPLPRPDPGRVSAVLEVLHASKG